jgi:hypothetical protein
MPDDQKHSMQLRHTALALYFLSSGISPLLQVIRDDVAKRDVEMLSACSFSASYVRGHLGDGPQSGNLLRKLGWEGTGLTSVYLAVPDSLSHPLRRILALCLSVHRSTAAMLACGSAVRLCHRRLDVSHAVGRTIQLPLREALHGQLRDYGGAAQMLTVTDAAPNTAVCSGHWLTSAMTFLHRHVP